MSVAQPLNAHQITDRSLPDLNISRTATVYQSNSAFLYVGTVTAWHDFEKEVRDTTRQHIWPTNPLTHETQNSLLNSEQAQCGNEIGVVGRFQQHIGQVMTCVGLASGMALRFGTWHGETDAGIPDITIWGPNGADAFAIGEVKTPWTRKLARLTMLWDQEIRHLEASQVFGNGTTENILWHSRAIKHTTRSRQVDNQAIHTAYIDNVSLRECMLYLMKRISGGDNTFPSPGDDPGTCTESSPPVSSSRLSSSTQGPTPRGRQQQSHGTSDPQYPHPVQKQPDATACLINGFSNLNVKGSDKSKPIPVKWSKHSRQYYYEDDRGKRRSVDKHRRVGDYIEVKIDGKTHRAIEVGETR
ncbi:MAG: hypothetical protein Q9219_007207 [cf. Caloplaca sp. 3 TL-2023]